MLWGALGGRHHLAACHVQRSRTGTQVALESLVAGSLGTWVLREERGSEGERERSAGNVFHLFLLESKAGLSNGFDGLVKLYLARQAVHNLQRRN